jgi:hypothetical protein
MVDMTQLEIAKRTLFDGDALDVKNVKVFPGTSREATPEQMAEQINKVLAQLADGDFDEITDASDD